MGKLLILAVAVWFIIHTDPETRGAHTTQSPAQPARVSAAPAPVPAAATATASPPVVNQLASLAVAGVQKLGGAVTSTALEQLQNTLKPALAQASPQAGAAADRAFAMIRQGAQQIQQPAAVQGVSDPNANVPCARYGPGETEMRFFNHCD